MRREITGTIFHTDDITPWKFGKIIFTRKQPHFTTNRQYPTDVEEVVTDINGNFSASLVCSNDNQNVISYQCYLPGDNEPFEFDFTCGLTINLTELKLQNTNITQPVTDTLKNYIDAQFALFGVTETRYQIFNASKLINTYQLTNTPTLPSLSNVYINGVKQQYSVDYNINNASLIILNPLPTNYILEVYYG